MFIPCGRLSWLPVSFLLHVKYTLPYRIVWRNCCFTTAVIDFRRRCRWCWQRSVTLRWVAIAQNWEKVDTTYWSTPQSANLFAATPSQSAGAWTTRHDIGSVVQPRILICTEQPTSRRVVVVNVFTSHIQFCIANRKARFACIVGKCDREIIHLPLLSNKIDS